MLQNYISLWLDSCENEDTKNGYQFVIEKFASWMQENYGLDVKKIPCNWRTLKYKNDFGKKEKFLEELNDKLGAYFIICQLLLIEH